MYYYTLPPIRGTGIGEDARRPDIPDGISWTGHPSEANDCYLLATQAEIPGRTALTEAELAAECERLGLNLADVLTWWVSPPDVPEPI